MERDLEGFELQSVCSGGFSYTGVHPQTAALEARAYILGTRTSQPEGGSMKWKAPAAVAALRNASCAGPIGHHDIARHEGHQTDGLF